MIDYPHIPPQYLFPPAAGEAGPRRRAERSAKNIGYVMGAGDEVPDALRQMGCDVTLLDADDLARGDLSRFDAIVTGVRAYNVRAGSARQSPGACSTTCRTAARWWCSTTADGGLGRRRRRAGAYRAVSDPDRPRPRHRGRSAGAPSRIRRTRCCIRPTKSPQRDFDGWVQERGLYFASEWDPHYQPLFESHDPGEQPLRAARCTRATARARTCSRRSPGFASCPRACRARSASSRIC